MKLQNKSPSTGFHVISVVERAAHWSGENYDALMIAITHPLKKYLQQSIDKAEFKAFSASKIHLRNALHVILNQYISFIKKILHSGMG